MFDSMKSDSKVCEFVTIKLLRTLLLNVTVIPFKIISLTNYSMQVISRLFKLVLWNCLFMSTVSSACVPFKFSCIFKKRNKNT